VHAPRSTPHDAPPLPTPPAQTKDGLRSFFGSESHSQRRAHADRKHSSVLDQLVHFLDKDLDRCAQELRAAVDEGTVLVVGGGYFGQRACKGAKSTPVLQKILKKLSGYFRIVVVDEVRGCGVGARRL